MILKAKPGAPTGEAAKPRALTNARSWETPPSQGPTERARLSERAHQDRDIVHFLQQPETSAFSLYHDYTESREGTDKYLNVVRTGSTVSKPSGKILDTGEDLKAEILTGAKMKAAGIDARRRAGRAGPGGRGHPLRAGEEGTVDSAAPLGNLHRAAELSPRWRRARVRAEPRPAAQLGRAAEGMVHLTELSIPAVVRQTPDGLTRVDFVNGRPDSVDVLLKAKRLK